jgi:hypothetical protein
LLRLLTSAFGTKQTLLLCEAMSAFGGKADRRAGFPAARYAVFAGAKYFPA